MDKRFRIPKSGGHVTDGVTVFDNSSRMEPKRSTRLFLDAAEPELFPSKRQAVEAGVSKTESGNVSNALSWESSSGFQSVPSLFMDRLFGTDPTRPINVDERRNMAAGMDGSNVRKSVSGEQLVNDSSVGLSMSYGMEHTEMGGSYGGIRKVKVNQVKEPENDLRTSVEHDLAMCMDQGYSKAGENTFISMGTAYGKEGENVTLMGHSYDIGNSNMGKGMDNAMLMTHSYNKGDSNTISFGGYQEESVLDSLARPVSSYSSLYNQPSVQASEMPCKKEADLPKGNANLGTSQTHKSRADSASKSKSDTKPAKKEAPNSFPSNVRSLLATSMLDGVPVRYVSVSREELRGTIKGSGYLCGCQSCNYSKALNAYEFERHAGCKTKHPNNHIYFENGKTIYQIVQELRNTPESMLFDTVQNVTGSPINQKAFRIWKESFQAATRELQRIYGKEQMNL